MNLRRWLIRASFWPTLLWNLALHALIPRRRWWDRVDDRLLVGALPLAGDVPRLKAEGVGAVVNLCEEYAGPEAEYARAGMVQLRLPTLDFTEPDVANLERGVAFIQEQMALGRNVYVHCKAGRGRSVALVLCWLIAARGLTPEQAQARVAERRPHVVGNLWRREGVQEFARRHAGRAPAK